MGLFFTTIAVILWPVSGPVLYVYWQRKIADITTDDLGIMVFSSFLGPIMYFIGADIYDDYVGKPVVQTKPKVLFKKKV